MKKNQSGFGIVGIVIIIVILCLIGILAWLIMGLHSSNGTANIQSSQPTITRKTATDTAKTFSYSYPSNWTVQKYAWSQCCEGPAQPEPDWSKQPQPIALKENHTTADADINITADISGNTTVDNAYNNRTRDQFNTYTRQNINGYETLYHVTDFVGPSSAEKYKDYEYIVQHGTEAVTFKFRARYSNATLNGKNDFDASKLTPQFNGIVDSIHFLK